MPGGGAALTNAQNARRKRVKKAAAIMMKYVLDKNLQATFLAEAHNNGRIMYQIYLRECVSAPDEQHALVLKAEINSSTILSTVGFKDNAVALYSRELSAMNGKIEPATSRFTEHDLTLHLLNAIGMASAHLKVDADKELKAAPAQRQFVHPVGHPLAGSRSLRAVVAHRRIIRCAKI